MSYLNQLRTKQQFEALRNEGNQFLVYLYHPGCTVTLKGSKDLHEAIAKFLPENVYQLDIVHDLPLADYILELTGVDKTSPLCLVIQDQQLLDHQSLANVNLERLGKYLDPTY